MRRLAPLAVLVLFAVPGCLSGTYDAAYQESLERYRGDAEFQRLHRDPKELAGNRLLIRVPKVFTAEDVTGNTARAKPPFLADFPGFCVAYETLLEAEGVQLPVVLTVGVPVDKDSGLDDLKKRILGQVQKEKSFAAAAWAAAEGRAAADTRAAWSILKLTGPQPFDRVNKGVTESKNSEGETQIWVSADPETRVAAVLAWRIPQELAAAVPLDELAEMVARTVDFKAAAAPAEPPPPAAAPQAPPAPAQ